MKKRGQRSTSDDEAAVVVRRAFQKLGVTDVFQLEQVYGPILAKILSYLNRAELVAIYNFSTRLRDIYQEFKLLQRLHTNQVFRLNEEENTWEPQTFLPSNVRQIVASSELMYVLYPDGIIRVWTIQANGQWNRELLTIDMPEGATPVVSFACNEHNDDGRLAYIYAVTDSGQLVERSPMWMPSVFVPFPEGERVISVTCCGSPTGGFKLALTAAGHVYAWGRNYSGSLGQGFQQQQQQLQLVDDPIRVMIDEPIIRIVCGYDYEYPVSFAIGQSGALYAWGVARSGMRVAWTPFKVKKPNGGPLPLVENVVCFLGNAVIHYRDGSHSLWTASSNVMLENIPDGATVIPWTRGGILIHETNGMLTWHSRDDAIPPKQMPLPVRLLSVRLHFLYCMTVSDEPSWFFKMIAAPCRVCGTAEASHVAWFSSPPKDGARLFCGQECYSKILLLVD